MTTWERYRYLAAGIAAVLVLVILAGFTAHFRDDISALERRVLDALAPVGGAASRLGQSIRGLWLSVAELGDVRAENARLRAELERLAALEPSLAELEAENLRLRAMLDFSPPPAYDGLAARVVGRSLTNWFTSLEVDRGTDDGVTAGAPVLTKSGLVGQIARVSSRTATVLLLVDPQSGVGAQIVRSREPGAVVGNAAFERTASMRLFSRDADVQVGDTVLTSGLGDVFPPGLHIGQVLSIDRDQQGLFVTAEVALAVDFARLEEVFILLSK